MEAEVIRVEAVPPGPVPIGIATTPDVPMDAASVRAAVMQAEATGDEVVNIPTQTSPLDQMVPTGTTATSETPKDVPAKFLKADGTVDVEKLQASTKQLDAATQQKEEKIQLTVDEMLAQYKESERKFRNLPSQPEQIQRAAQAQMPVPPAPPPVIPQEQVAAQIRQEYERDPVGTIFDIVKAVTEDRYKPVAELIEKNREQERDTGLKRQISELAQEDPRIVTHYAQVMAELQSDPGYLSLRNPHKAAWNEVKGRLRLGEVQTPPQPSRSASPILGGGTPPPVPSTVGSPTPGNIMQAIGEAKNPDELARAANEVRRIANSADWSS